MERYDAVVVGGGPAGSGTARWLSRAGCRVALLDRAAFPRVKLCAGWLSAPIWDALELRPADYPGGLWAWDRCHVDFGGRRYTTRARGWFIRRYELDAWLLAQSGADVHQLQVKRIERDGDEWVIEDRFRARWLIGAGGTHCPVARSLFPAKPRRPVGAREHEFRADAGAIAATRVGADGEPQLLLHDDLRGYSWNIPKTDWLNVGCGTVDAREVLAAWEGAREHFVPAVPPQAGGDLDRMKGHSYYLFDPAHLAAASVDGALLVGDALGLAQPLTAEGILPGVLSGRIAAGAITDDAAADYGRRLAAHPTFRDYAVLHAAREAGASLRRGDTERRGNGAARAAVRRVTGPLVAGGFAWLFGGKPLPAGRLLHRIATRSARSS